MTGNEIREKFLRYFEQRGHRRVRSSSLVPHGDPTLLFTNAGMNQFKDVFLGLEQRDYKRATTSQKCVRAGGKHNDLENVGFTNRHLTFFEMLGNFSFGDYFKKDAIAFAWELITSREWFALPVEKLYFTVFGGAEVSPGNTLGVDSEASELWAAVGAAKDRIIAIPGLKENFWAMGDTGPCGPCSEIHYDMGAGGSDQGHADCKFPCDCGRYVEIWNLVFMQFNRDASGALAPLPKPCVDTGMGLDRVTAVLQGKVSIFDSDLFQPLMKRAADLCGVDLDAEVAFENRHNWAASLRVIADHARASTFIIADGVTPSNEGRGYVLRKIMRRAINHGRMLGAKKPFLHEMTHSVRDVMKIAYPELEDSIDQVRKIVYAEEDRFGRTIERGLREWDDLILSKIRDRLLSELDEEKPSSANAFTQAYGLYLKRNDPAVLIETVERELGARRAERFEQQWSAKDVPPVRIEGDEAFRLWDTFGFSLDFMQEITRDQGHALDVAGFDRAMAEQRERAKASWKGVHKEAAKPIYAKLRDTYRTEPDFYRGSSARDCHIEAIITKDGPVNEIKAGQEAEIVLDRTVIYAESGGQVADTGAFFDNGQTLQVAEVKGAYYPVAGLIAHRVVAKEDLHVGDRVAVVADAARREHVMRNHTGTHLVHAALRNILGTHVKQAGSLNAPDHLRFDFSHFVAVDQAELREIEQQVNEEILRNIELQTDVTTLDDALASGALAFFGDKYPEANVRVVTIPDAEYPLGFYSKELCGGTHVHRAGDIGVFKIVSEQSVAAGVRRIEALTGVRAFTEYQKALETLRQLAAMLNTSEGELAAVLERTLAHSKQLEKQVEALKRKTAQSKLDDLSTEAREVKGVKVLAAKVDDIDRDSMRQLVDSLRQRLGSGVVVLGTVTDGKVALIAGVTKDLTGRVQAGKIVQILAKALGGSGGGRPDLAEAGGKDTSALESTLRTVPDLVSQLL